MTTVNTTEVPQNDNVTWSFGNEDDNITTTLGSSTSSSSSFISSTTTDMSTSPAYYYDGGNDYPFHIYTAYPFERPVYLYIWEVLVIVTCLVNVLVISILLRKHMRNATNIILATIAVTDSLTGLCTLPTYIMVFMSHEVPDMYSESNYDYSYAELSHNETTTAVAYTYDFSNSTMASDDGSENSSDFFAGQDIYYLSESLCNWFMTSKLFLSKSFHTMSIYLTLCLGIHRFISVAVPLKARLLTTTNALITCLIVVVLSPLLHIYHFTITKTQYGNCQWEMEEEGCKGGCAYLWVTFFLRQFFPCTILLVCTVLFIRELRKSEVSVKEMVGKNNQSEKRTAENRRVCFIVTFIVVIFLIAEIPYGVFTFYNAVDKTHSNGKNIDLKRNRSIHLAYEILLVLSFHANFYVYTLFNRKFRKCLKQLFRRDVSGRTSVSTSSQRTARQTELISMKSRASTDNTLQSSSNSVVDKPDVESRTMLN